MRQLYFHRDCAADDPECFNADADSIIDDKESYMDVDGTVYCEVCGEPSAEDASRMARAEAEARAAIGGLEWHQWNDRRLVERECAPDAGDDE